MCRPVQALCFQLKTFLTEETRPKRDVPRESCSRDTHLSFYLPIELNNKHQELKLIPRAALPRPTSSFLEI